MVIPTSAVTSPLYRRVTLRLRAEYPHRNLVGACEGAQQTVSDADDTRTV